MADWKRYTLAELVTIKYGKNQKKVISEKGTIPIYGTGGLIGYATEALYNEPSVLIGRKGTIGRVKYVEHPFWTVDTLFYTIVNTKIVIPKYLYNVMSQIDLNSYNEGTTIPSLRMETLNRLEFYIPTLQIQERILSCINPIDDKIEENEKINNNLLEQARSIFQSWFIDFEPFGCSAPSEWQLSTLGQIAVIKTDSWSPSKNADSIVEHYSIPAFDEQHYPVFENASRIKSNKYILTPASVMISKLNPDIKRIWRPMCLSAYPVCSTEFIVYEAKKDGQKDYIYSILDSIPFFNHLCSHTTGSTNSRQRATPKSTLEFILLLPPDSVIEDFCHIVTPMYDLITSNIIENQSLARARDRLLPRLMDGELDVSELSI